MNTGKIVEKCWLEIPQHYPKTVLHHYVVMPNHIHGIIEIMGPAVGVEYFRPATMVENIRHDVQVENIRHDERVENIPSNVRVENIRPLPPRPKCESGSVGAIVRGFKIGTTKLFGYSVWQRNYWDNIIRNEQSYQHIANYIINNPKSWENDRFNSE